MLLHSSSGARTCCSGALGSGAWLGASLAQRISGAKLSRVFALALLATGCTMLRASVA